MPKKVDPKQYEGKEGINKFGSIMVIEKYSGKGDIIVSFPEYNYKKNSTVGEFNRGSIKCPYEPRVFDRGYIGEGKYNCKDHEKCYKYWNRIMERCYTKNIKTRNKNITYEECEVDERWYNFQNFANWYYENYYEVSNETMCLDKDLLVNGNKIYGPDTCCFIPNNINILFKNQSRNKEDSLPKGITKRKDISKNKYRVVCNKFIDGKSKKFNLGQYKTLQEAINALKEFKELYVKEVANKYKDFIPDNVYIAMMNWEWLYDN